MEKTVPLPYMIQRTSTSKKEEAFSDLRSLAFDDNKVALLDASMGIRVLDDNLKLKKEIAIDTDFGLYTKRSIDFVGDKIIVAEGTKGAGVYSYDSGTLLQYIPIIIDPNDTNCRRHCK